MGERGELLIKKSDLTTRFVNNEILDGMGEWPYSYLLRGFLVSLKMERWQPREVECDGGKGGGGLVDDEVEMKEMRELLEGA